MKQLILVGASSWGLETYSWHKDAIGYGKDWEFKGFLDDNKSAFKDLASYQNFLLSDIDSYQLMENDVFLCTIADPIIKAEIVEKLNLKGAKFLTLRHQSVLFFDESTVTVGEGCILAPNSVVSIQVNISNHVGINVACTIGHNVNLGDYTQLSAHINLAGFVQIGEKVFIGSSACFIPNAVAEDRSIIGAGALVLRRVKQETTVFGNPAKIFRKSY